MEFIDCDYIHQIKDFEQVKQYIIQFRNQMYRKAASHELIIPSEARGLLFGNTNATNEVINRIVDMLKNQFGDMTRRTGYNIKIKAGSSSSKKHDNIIQKTRAKGYDQMHAMLDNTIKNTLTLNDLMRFDQVATVLNPNNEKSIFTTFDTKKYRYLAIVFPSGVICNRE